MALNFDNMSPEQILEKIESDKSVCGETVTALSNRLGAHRVIDRDEVKLLFQINQAVGSNDDQCPDWTEFFVSNVSRLVVFDMETPGAIDESEGDWLGGVLHDFRVNNETENKLLAELQHVSSSIQGRLGEMVNPPS